MLRTGLSLSKLSKLELLHMHASIAIELAYFKLNTKVRMGLKAVLSLHENRSSKSSYYGSREI
jgi:hypothetical protein